MVLIVARAFWGTITDGVVDFWLFHEPFRSDPNPQTADIKSGYRGREPRTTHLPKKSVMSVKCEQPLDELTVQFWLLSPKSNFKYCTLYAFGMELRKD